MDEDWECESFVPNEKQLKLLEERKLVEESDIFLIKQMFYVDNGEKNNNIIKEKKSDHNEKKTDHNEKNLEISKMKNAPKITSVMTHKT